MDSTSVIIGLLLFVNIGEAGYIYCAQCNGTSPPTDCINYARCGDNEDCYVEEKNEYGVRTYTLGCLSSTVCDHVTPYLFGRSINRRDVDSCVQCCKSNGCNTRLCRDDSFTTTTTRLPSFYSTDMLTSPDPNGLWRTTETTRNVDFSTTTTTPSPDSSNVMMSTLYPPPNDLDCDFEHGMCGWSQSHTDMFDWTRHSGSTSSQGTGPSVDHTLGTGQGHYLYTESSNPRHPGDIARLVSYPLPPTDVGCLKFWYHMYGSGMGSLEVIMLEEHNATNVWSATGYQGNAWRYAQVNVQAKNPFQLAFQGIIGISIYGDIAIDDVSYNDEKCRNI